MELTENSRRTFLQPKSKKYTKLPIKRKQKTRKFKSIAEKSIICSLTSSKKEEIYHNYSKEHHIQNNPLSYMDKTKQENVNEYESPPTPKQTLKLHLKSIFLS